MVEIASERALLDAFVPEDEHLAAAREASAQFGIEPVSPALGAALAMAAAARPAAAMIEIGTGTGVSSLCLLRGAPEAHLTSIDEDLDLQQVARGVLADAGIAARQVRLITGRVADVLPRMNESAYDVVLVDVDARSTTEVVTTGLRLVCQGGVVLVPHVLDGGAGRRDLLDAIRDRSDLLAALSPVGDGLLQLLRRA